MRRKKVTRARDFAISLLALSCVLMFSTVSFAETKAGTVTRLRGPLFAKKLDGRTKALSVKSAVGHGDILITKKKTYARIKFTDNGKIVLRPNTHFRVVQYYFDHTAPKKDSAVFHLVKGGVRSITGMIGSRGERDRYKFMTKTAVAGIRGTIYEARICEGDCGSIPDGLYFFVVEGSIIVSNSAGSQTFSAGQYVYVANETSMPVLLPANPGIDFSLPTSFETESEQLGSDESCEVR
jgi:hypothetical protein